jgi:ABC-type polar amino acid transport system ATPase subunit
MGDRAVIELLGIGISRPDRHGWLVREGSARLESGQLVIVSADTSAARLAVLDVVAGRCIPIEGRAWIHHVPLMRETARRIQRFGGEVIPGGALRSRCSLLGAVMIASRDRGLGPPVLPSRRARAMAAAALEAVGLADRAHEPTPWLSRAEQSRVVIARALARGARHLAVRELDRLVPPHEVRPLLDVLRSLTRHERRLVIVTMVEPAVAIPLADRHLHIVGDRFLEGAPRDDHRRPELVRT